MIKASYITSGWFKVQQKSKDNSEYILNEFIWYAYTCCIQKKWKKIKTTKY